MPLEVAFYSDALTSSQYGLGRYARELYRALGQIAPEIVLHPVSSHARSGDFQSALVLPYSRRVTAGLWSTLGWPPLERWIPSADLVHCVELDYRVATRKPLVVTIHDIGPLTHPEYFRRSHPWLLKTALKSALNRAAAIICVSRATAAAVEEYGECRLGDRLAIVPEGVAEEFFEPEARGPGFSGLPFTSSSASSPIPFPPETPYFLWAGSLNPRKNLPRVIAAFEQAAPQIPHHLVLSGSAGWDSDQTFHRLRKSPAAHRIHLPGHLSDAQLRGLYRGATAFIYVSLMEGFGLPILEAMACGCPVITSNLSSMPEVAGDAAFLINPEDTEEIAGAMHCVATDPVFAQYLAGRGSARAQEFRWSSCAHAVANTYQRVSRKPAKRREKLPSQPNHPHSARLVGSQDSSTMPARPRGKPSEALCLEER